MIVFDLICSNEHIFEAWFADSQTYENQVVEGVVSCPVCGDVKIKKAPMAPNISTSKQRSDSNSSEATAIASASSINENPSLALKPENVAEAMKVLKKMQQHIKDNFDHVGEKFPEEVRKMHYGESDHRNVYGDATPEEADELREEGIDVSQMPWLPRHDT
jgi:hypothetical protein|tara:strand:- start:521 stop:1003 length:483 start_codon:yes stop_codon:yes gene_type:complete